MNLIKNIFLFDYKTFKRVLIIVLLSFFPFLSFAQSNPFKQENPSNMVNLFTGDFNYSIPLLGIPLPGGSYPITINYQSGIKLEQEASWVGLGWFLGGIGAIKRKVIQYPDDANGALIINEISHGNSDAKKFTVYNISPNSENYYSNSSVIEPKVNSTYGLLYLQDIPYYTDGDFYNNDGSYVPPWEKFEARSNFSYYGYIQSQLRGEIINVNDPVDCVSDVIQENSEGMFYNNMKPLYQAKDIYSLVGPISGQIEPVRFDNPSASMSFPYKNNYDYENSYERKKYYKRKVTNYQQEKVQFRLKGELSNSYAYHKGSDNTINVDVIDEGLINNKLHKYVVAPVNDQPINFNNVEPSREGFNSLTKELSQSTYIRWFNNKEFNDGTAKSSGLINTSSSFLKDSDLPEHGIGGFMVTDANGMTYHYTIAVYNKDQIFHTSFNNKTSRFIKEQPIAEEWLLTAITGSDYIDRGTIGILDEEDYGYWIKFQFGKLHSEFPWRFPYIGESHSLSDVDVKFHEEGKREIYYLNYIQTPTHTALFNKTNRIDAKSYKTNSAGHCLSKLKLKEIILLTNKNFNLLKSQNFQMGEVLIDSDFSTLHKSFIAQNQLGRVSFTLDNILCRRTPNSFNSLIAPQHISNTRGKLTLRGIKSFGFNNISTKPDYTFSYSINPNYHKEKWDAWGAYKNRGEFPSLSYGATDDGNAWNLDKITTPTGTEVLIEYERDDYKSVNGYNTILFKNYNYSSNLQQQHFYLSGGNKIYTIGSENLEDWVNVGDQLLIVPSVTGMDCLPKLGNLGEQNIVFNSSVEVVSVDENKIVFKPDISLSYNLYSENWCESFTNDVSISFESLASIATRKGDNVRVSRIQLRDPISEMAYSYKYIYTKDGSISGESSGVASAEPEGLSTGRNFNYKNIKLGKPVFIGYKNVRVSQEVENSKSSYTDYTFHTPHHSMIQLNKINNFEYAILTPFYIKKKKNLIGKVTEINRYGTAYKNYVYETVVSDNIIGQLKEVKTYSKDNILISKQEYSYDYPENSIGLLTQAANLNDICDREYSYVFDDPDDPDDDEFTDFDKKRSGNKRHFRRIINSITTYKPLVLKSVKTTSALGQEKISNIEFEYLTGQIVKQQIVKAEETNLIETKFAFKENSYHEMGSKFIDVKNKNMLMQTVGKKMFKIKTNQIPELISATVKTWSNSIPFRYFDSGGAYYNRYDSLGIWRLHESYNWNSSVDNDGVYEFFIDYNFSQASENETNGWVKTSEVKLYNPYSSPLEIRDVNGNSSAKKLSSTQSRELINSSNARLTEIYFSGAENVEGSNGVTEYFEGEVSGAFSRYEDESSAHTGKSSVKQFGGNQSDAGFNIAGSVGSDDSNTFNRKNYRASVWVHKNRINSAELRYVTKNSQNEIINEDKVDVDDENTIKAGDWYLFQLDISLVSEQISYLNVFTHKKLQANQSSYCLFDDFRFQPINSTTTSYVYDDKGNLTAVLDPNNLATKYHYDEAGRLLKVEREFADDVEDDGGFKKMKEFEYNYAREIE